MDAFIFSVVIPAYNAGDHLIVALESLERQLLDRPIEVLVVDSGPISCAPKIRARFPQVRIIRSRHRLLPGGARNAGIRQAQGEFVAFMSVDTVASPQWLSERFRHHRAGFEVVGGSIVNGLPGHPIAVAEYLLEYSALMPIEELLLEQEIPHALSFARSVFDRCGLYPEHVTTGEDTLFNRLCLRSGVSVTVSPRASLTHHGSTRISTMLSHAWKHGEGLAECIEFDGLESALGEPHAPTLVLLGRAALLYPMFGWWAKLKRLRRHAPQMVPRFLVLSPLIVAAMVATGVGAWARLCGFRGPLRGWG